MIWAVGGGGRCVSSWDFKGDFDHDHEIFDIGLSMVYILTMIFYVFFFPPGVCSSAPMRRELISIMSWEMNSASVATEKAVSKLATTPC